MQATSTWYQNTGGKFLARSGMSRCAHLTHYTVNYQEWGSGPPLVLVPGLAGGYELLGPLAQELSKHFRVISYQLRGEDNCFALRQPFGFSDLVADLRELLDWLCLESPTVFGVSFGGLLALEFAARHPRRLGNLVIQGAGAKYEKGLIQLIAGEVLGRIPLPSNNRFINQFFNLFFGGPQQQDARFEFVTNRCWQTDQSVMAHRFSLVESFSMDQRLTSIQVPTLIMAGEKDVLVSNRSLRQLKDGIPNARFQRLRQCGHLAFVTHPEVVAHQTREFLLN